jgi:hypothetical protein
MPGLRATPKGYRCLHLQQLGLNTFQDTTDPKNQDVKDRYTLLDSIVMSMQVDL